MPLPTQASRPASTRGALAVPAPRRYRDREHLRFVARQPCLAALPGLRPQASRSASSPHAQPPALGRKASNEFTVPLCRIHHRLVHRVGNEAAWWQDAGIDPIIAARKLWGETRVGPARQALGRKGAAWELEDRARLSRRSAGRRARRRFCGESTWRLHMLVCTKSRDSPKQFKQNQWLTPRSSDCKR